jgi:hypothetical protein
MNRIVIIGNGFDLAQGLETGYEHFLVDLLKEELIKTYKVSNYLKNKLFSFNSEKYNFNDFDSFTNKISSLKDFNNLFISQNRNRYIKFNNESDFFKKILNNKNWTDIEKVYFNCLIEIVEKPDKLKFQEQILKLNADFDYVKSKLVEYLNKVEKSINHSKTLVPFMELLKSFLIKPEEAYLERFFKLNPEEIKELELSQTYFLNFSLFNLLRVTNCPFI